MTVLENAARWKPASGGFVRKEDEKIMGLSKSGSTVDRLPSRDSAARCEVPRQAFRGAGHLSGP